ncbi:MAG: HAMP domain-containing sensor histidine kinase [Pseudomonadota bacterium]
MSLSRRLTLSLLAILLIFSLNVGTHFWGSFARTESMNDYRESVSAQQLATGLGVELDEQRTQVRVLAALRETTPDRLSDEDRDRAIDNLGNITDAIMQLGATTHDVTRPQYDELWTATQQLLPVWEAFYGNYNDPGWQPAYAEADAPTLYDDVRERLMILEERQSFISDQQATIIDQTIALTDRITAISFLASVFLSGILGVFLIRYTNRSFSRLKTGTLRIGAGDLDYRIDGIEDAGEIGELAKAFNHMTGKLRTAVEDVRRAKENADRANEAKSSFLANVSHELRTPLNAIIGYSEMLHDELGDSTIDREQFRNDLGKIIMSGKQLLALINDILDLSKIETGKIELYPENFSAGELLEQACQTIEPLLARNNNRLKMDVADKLPMFFNDAVKFRQVFVNLLSNACKFTENGEITVRAEPLEGADPLVLFSVDDTGIGMTAAQQTKVFDAFVQADKSTSRNYGGTGLGLAICKDYCEMMGGTITVESEPEVGTSFRVVLPVQAHHDLKSDHEAA